MDDGSTDTDDLGINVRSRDGSLEVAIFNGRVDIQASEYPRVEVALVAELDELGMSFSPEGAIYRMCVSIDAPGRVELSRDRRYTYIGPSGIMLDV